MSTERKRLVAKLDKVFSEYIRKRDKACVCCGTTENLQCGHLFSRNAYSTRWDVMNAYAQCRSCNYRHEYDPYALTDFFLRKFGKKAYDRLHQKYVSPTKFKDGDLKGLIEYFKQRLEV